MRAAASAGAGFLLAVLWFDLMFDVQVRRGLNADTVGSIARYYRRVTTDARPMNRLVAAAMVATLLAIVGELLGDAVPGWAAALSLVLALVPIAVAGTRTVPRAVRLGAQTDPPAVQAEAAVRIFREHRFCFACISLLLVVQLLAR